MAQLQPFLNLDFQYGHPSKDLFPGNLHVEKVEDQLGNGSEKKREKFLKISFLQYIGKNSSRAILKVQAAIGVAKKNCSLSDPPNKVW